MSKMKPLLRAGNTKKNSTCCKVSVLERTQLRVVVVFNIDGRSRVIIKYHLVHTSILPHIHHLARQILIVQQFERNLISDSKPPLNSASGKANPQSIPVEMLADEAKATLALLALTPDQLG
mmetsp:Transcript_34452/g.67987  ORF Transcript_34452/g.67987 Transcript_34452/m.67987 type:complete len:121 (+) Transcript_34452:200-562(+)